VEQRNSSGVYSDVMISGSIMDTLVRYRAMEKQARQHARLDVKTAERWKEEAEIWARLLVNEERAARLQAMKPEIWARHAGKAKGRSILR
jgi:hypothetical protein